MGLHYVGLTGRTRTLRLAGTFSMPYGHSTDGTFAFNPQNYEISLSSSGEVNFGPYQIRIRVRAGNDEPTTPSVNQRGSYTLEVFAPSPLSINSIQNVELWPLFTAAALSGTISGSFELEVDVAEEMETKGLPAPELSWWNINDGPAIVMEYREKLRGSSNVRVNVTFGSLSYVQSFNRPNSEAIGVGIGGYSASALAAVRTRERGGAVTASIEMENTNMWANRSSSQNKSGTIPYKYGFSAGESISNVPYQQDVSSSTGVSASHNFDGGLSQSFGGNQFIFQTFQTAATVTQFVPQSGLVHGRVKLFEDDPADTFTFNLAKLPAGGNDLVVPPGGATYAVHAFNGLFSGLTSTPPAGDDFGAGTTGSFTSSVYPYDAAGEPNYEYEARLKEASFPANTDETSDPRIQGRGITFGSIQIDHEDEQVIEAFSGPSGWTPANSTLGGSSTLTILTGGIGGGATRIYSPTKITEAWRYWTLRFRSVGDDNINFRLRVNEKKSFYLQTGLDGDYQTLTIDTCFPGLTESGVPAQQDSRYPVKGVSDNRPTTEGKNWGINYIEKLEFLDIPPGMEIEIDELKAVTEEQPHLQFISAHYNSRVSWYSLAPAASPEIKRHLLGLVDGRTGLEIGDHRGIPPMAYVPISSYVSDVSVNGWSALASGFGDIYFNDTLPSQFIAGEGAIWTASGFTTYTDKPMVAGSLSVPCQFLFDRLRIYPGIGDPFEGSGYNNPEATINVRYLKFMRGAGHGFAIKSSGPAVGENITIYRYPEGDGRGSGVSDAGGFFSTGLNYAYGNRTYDYKSASRTLGAGTIYTRKRQRVSGKATVTNGGRIAYDVSSALRHYYARIDETDTVQIGYSDNRIDWTEVDAGISGVAVALAVERRGKSAILYLWVQTDSGSIHRHTSENEGGTWSLPTTIATGEINGVAAEIGLNGHRYVYWIEGDPAAVMGRIFDASDATLEAEFTAIEGVDEDGLAVAESVEGLGKHRIVILVNQGGTLKSFKSYDGIDFV